MAKVTFDTVWKMGTTLPGVEKSTSPRGTSLQVGGKMLACEATNKSAEPDTLLVRIDPDQREVLIAEAPDIYYLTDHYLNYPTVLVRLRHVNKEALHDLLQSSARFVSRGTRRKRKRMPE